MNDYTRFISKVNKVEGGCWLWTGALNNYKYGSFWGHKQVGAHRWSFEYHKGPIPKGLGVHHSCDEPSCVNPDHLSVGTQKQNIADAIKRNRLATKDRQGSKTHPEKVNKGVKNGNSKLKDDDVREIRILYGFGFSQRELAEMYGVKRSPIAFLLNGKTWKHVI